MRPSLHEPVAPEMVAGATQRNRPGTPSCRQTADKHKRDSKGEDGGKQDEAKPHQDADRSERGQQACKAGQNQNPPGNHNLRWPKSDAGGLSGKRPAKAKCRFIRHTRVRLRQGHKSLPGGPFRSNEKNPSAPITVEKACG